MKSKLGMMSMFAAMAIMGTETPHRERDYYPNGENNLYALNQKNADKKARSKHWLVGEADCLIFNNF